jgi:hypothetical protein
MPVLTLSQPLELLKTRFQLNAGQPMRIMPAVKGAYCQGYIAWGYCCMAAACQ